MNAPALTPRQRRAFIDTARRSQPLAELLRKMRRAAGLRRTRAGWPERIDVDLAEGWRYGGEQRPHYAAVFSITYCWLCSAMATPGATVEHRPRCPANPTDDGPYPGWAAAGRPGRLA